MKKIKDFTFCLLATALFYMSFADILMFGYLLTHNGKNYFLLFVFAVVSFFSFLFVCTEHLDIKKD